MSDPSPLADAPPTVLAAIACQLVAIRSWLIHRQAYALAQRLEPLIEAMNRARQAAE